MFDHMKVCTEGMKTRILQQQVIANNLANANTVGFKRDRVFQEELSAASVSEPGQAPAAIQEVTDFEQGSIRETGNRLDFALSGNGFFAVETENGVRYTRNGHFHTDPEGRLVLQGAGTVLGENGPIVLEGEAEVNGKGEIYVNGAYVDRFRIAAFDTPDPLRKAGNSLFRPADDRLQEIPAESPGVSQGYLEESNVDPIREMVDMITVFRYFEADQRVMRTQDEILGKAANDVGRV